MSDIVIIEPFYGGSHKQLIDFLRCNLPIISRATVFSLPAKKWHWRARVSALQFSMLIPTDHNFKILFCSSVLSLAELCGLRPDLGHLKKILYFHENQLVYPIQDEKHRDFQYGYNQITSSINADVILFNSEFNMNSFLSSISSYLNLMPDFKIKDLQSRLRHKCSVLYFPIDKPLIFNDTNDRSNICRVLWPHRWEHDKNPDLLFKVLFELKQENISFRLSVIGEKFSEIPKIFAKAEKVLQENIDNWGYISCRDEYYRLLKSSDIVISTAEHEFYGVAMIEAALHGCIPICPKKLSYPEIFSELAGRNCAYFYNTDCQLKKIIKSFCIGIVNGHRKPVNRAVNMECLKKFLWNEELSRKYENIFSV